MKFLLISLLLFLPYEIVFGKPTDLFDDVQNTRLIALENDVFQAEVMEVSFLNEYYCQAQVPNPNSPEVPIQRKPKSPKLKGFRDLG